MHRAALLIALALAACATVPAASAGPTAGFGQVARTDGPSVRPISLIEDSRCPVDVQCVWAGRVQILAEIDLRGGSETLRREITLGEPIAIDDGKLTLVAAEPVPNALTRPNLNAYRFTFRFERRD